MHRGENSEFIRPPEEFSQAELVKGVETYLAQLRAVVESYKLEPTAHTNPNLEADSGLDMMLYDLRILIPQINDPVVRGQLEQRFSELSHLSVTS